MCFSGPIPIPIITDQVDDKRYFEPIYVSGVQMKMNGKIINNKSSDKKKRSLNAFKHAFNSENC